MPAKDEWAQIGYIEVVESAANTLTFNGLSVFSNILTPKGLIIHRVIYNIPSASQILLAASADYIMFGLAGDDSLLAIHLDEARVYDYRTVMRIDYGVAASGNQLDGQFVTDFSSLPGGGLLVPADRIYAYVAGVSLANPVTMQFRFYFTVQDLTAQQYIELAQSLRVLT